MIKSEYKFEREQKHKSECKSGCEYKTWFGIIRNCGEVKLVGENSIDNVENECRLPFNLPEVALKLELFKSEREYYKKLRKEAIAFFRNKALLDLKREDRYVIMLVKMLDELNESINLLENKIEDVEEVRESELCFLAREKLAELKDLRRKVEKEIEEIVEKIAPNLFSILGGILTARLLEKAGSLKRLAEMPSSTIQIIGAEKSLYKAISRMKKGKKAKMPKHGIIYQHPFIRGLPKKKRGKMSRFMASKIAIAARVDYFSGELLPELASQVRRRYEELRRLGG